MEPVEKQPHDDFFFFTVFNVFSPQGEIHNRYGCQASMILKKTVQRSLFLRKGKQYTPVP